MVLVDGERGQPHRRHEPIDAVRFRMRLERVRDGMRFAAGDQGVLREEDLVATLDRAVGAAHVDREDVMPARLDGLDGVQDALRDASRVLAWGILDADATWLG